MLALYFCVKMKLMQIKKLLPAVLIAALALNITSCKKDDEEDVVPTETSYELTGNISSNKSLSADKVWTLKGYVYVQSGATLTIPAGTIIKSDVIDKGAIIVERGGKIVAEGTADKPIVFTSGLPKGQRRPGDWGGIILLGKAPTNRSTEPKIEGGVDRNYGGTDPNDNSGVLKYVRIEFAGIAAAPGSEINGLTLGGVGAGTTIENVMVSYGNDDAFEFFGGTVKCKNLIAFATSDDDFDFDYGFTGGIDRGIVLRHPQFVDAGDAGNGIECDNDGTGTGATPFTHPVLNHITFVGPNGAANTGANHNFANRWRRASQFELMNSIMIGFQKGGFSIESAETSDAYKNGISKFTNNLVHAVAAPFKGSTGTMTSDEIKAKALADGCVELAKAEDAQLAKPFDLKAPNFAPAAGSEAATRGIGAITGTDWTAGWTNWTPNDTDY